MIAITPKRTCESRSRRSTRGTPLVAESAQRQAEQDRKRQHLEDLAAGERAHRRVGDDVQQVVHRRERLPARCVGGDLLRVERLNVRVDPGARAHDVDHDQADHQGEGRDQLEIDERLQSDPADLLHVADLGDPDHHRREDDRGDHHLDQLDEAVSQGLHRRRRRRVEIAERHADRDGGEHLKVQVCVQRPVSRRGLHGDWNLNSGIHERPEDSIGEFDEKPSRHSSHGSNLQGNTLSQRHRKRDDSAFPCAQFPVVTKLEASVSPLGFFRR